MQLEWHQLDMRYAALRIASRKRDGQLMALLAEQGQQSPVSVVPGEVKARYVLIDGYRRAAALKRLGRDTIEALVLSLSEPAALLWQRGQEVGRRRSMLEDGWLIEALSKTHGLCGADVARRLGRSQSWVSRRAALVCALPESVQRQITKGQLCPYGASKYLVPLARAKPRDCETLVENIAGEKISVRQMHKLYVGWRQSDTEARQRLISHPMLFLSASAAAEGEHSKNSRNTVLNDLHTVDAIFRRLARQLRAEANDQPIDQPVRDAWTSVQNAFDGLFEWLRT